MTPILVSTELAAQAMQVTPAAIRNLASRGSLTRHGTARRRLYDLWELRRVEATRLDTMTCADARVPNVGVLAPVTSP